MNIHPTADIFPMMNDDERGDLAADIKANGLIHPIILDADGQLIDGWNRLTACKLAGVEPRCETIDGVNPVALIMATHVKRLDLSKGQQPMAWR